MILLMTSDDNRKFNLLSYSLINGMMESCNESVLGKNLKRINKRSCGAKIINSYKKNGLYPSSLSINGNSFNEIKKKIMSVNKRNGLVKTNKKLRF